MIIEVKQGLLDGGEEKSILTGQTYYYFLGIPYAEPPIRDLRFRPPRPAKNWNGIFNAKNEKNKCIQMPFGGGTTEGSEDCLYLNVYTPQLPIQNTPLKAVMVHIHGGGLFAGSGSMAAAAPDYLIKQDIVIVSLNYRLHILGFLNMGIPSCPGNCGLKDQTMALTWVRENIRYFGGDPENVTIFGESAGGISAHLHTLSPLSKGLFHRAILESGTWLVPVPHVEHPLDIAFAAGKKLGFEETDAEKLVEFFKKQPVEDLLRVADEMRRNFESGGVPRLPFIQSIETITQNAFLPDHPLNLMRTAEAVPLIAGVCDKEGVICFSIMPPKKLETLDDQFTNFIKDYVCSDESKVSQIAAKVKKFYFGEKMIGQDTRDELINLFSDLMYIKLYDSFNYNNGGAPFYMYEFTFDGKFNATKLWTFSEGQKRFFKGASHCDHSGYLFYFKSLLPNPEFEEPENTVINNMCSLWANFAKTGNPTPDPPTTGTEWRPSTTDKPTYLKIGENLELINGEIWQERRAFWNEIFRIIKEQE